MANRLDVSDQTDGFYADGGISFINHNCINGVWDLYFGVLERIDMLETKMH